MKGLSAATGRAIAGEAHLRQSIADILFTPRGSRVMRRDYGSLLSELMDAPANRSTVVRLYGATAGALRRWEPRLKLKTVQLTRGDGAGAFVLRIGGLRTDTPQPTPVSFDLLFSRAGATVATA